MEKIKVMVVPKKKIPLKYKKYQDNAPIIKKTKFV